MTIVRRSLSRDSAVAALAAFPGPDVTQTLTAAGTQARSNFAAQGCRWHRFGVLVQANFARFGSITQHPLAAPLVDGSFQESLASSCTGNSAGKIKLDGQASAKVQCRKLAAFEAQPLKILVNRVQRQNRRTYWSRQATVLVSADTLCHFARLADFSPTDGTACKTVLAATLAAAMDEKKNQHVGVWVVAGRFDSCAPIASRDQIMVKKIKA